MRRNVLHLIDSFHQGGTERQAVQLARLLHESGHYGVHIACLNPEGMLRAEVERLGIGRIPDFPLTSFYDRNAARQLRRLVKFLHERKIDIVHTHDFYTNIFGMTAARLAGTTARIASRRETSGMRSGAQRWIQQQAYSFSHAIIANAEAVRAKLVEEGIRTEKIVTIYNGLDLGRVMPPSSVTRIETLQKFDLPGESPNHQPRRYVTIVANLRHPVKDHPTFLRAAQRVRAAVPEAAFVIAGEGELMEDHRNLAAELGIEQDVFFTGRCENVGELLSISDVCVLSSTAEGFSNSILEYMAAARPVVATDVGGAREAIVDGETGYLVAAGDDTAMANHIAALLNDPAGLERMGQRGREVVEEKFSCEAQLERTQGLYDRLLRVSAKQARVVEPVEGVSRRNA